MTERQRRSQRARLVVLIVLLLALIWLLWRVFMTVPPAPRPKVTTGATGLPASAITWGAAHAGQHNR